MKTKTIDKNIITTSLFILALALIVGFFVNMSGGSNQSHGGSGRSGGPGSRRRHNHGHDEKGEMSNICRGRLSDHEYLTHMIPHHQVAVDISVLLQKKSKNPMMQEILRKLIWTQQYEIKLMESMIDHIPENDMSSSEKMTPDYMETVADMTPPNLLGLTQTYCDPHFFNPKKHMEHMKHIGLDDEIYIKHMIPHHQVAVDMSKVLLQNTRNDFMIYLAYRIIQSQQSEIILLNDLLNNKYTYQSSLLL